MLHLPAFFGNLVAPIHPTYEPGQRATGMRETEAKTGEAVQEPAEDQMRRRDGCVERKADQVIEKIGLKPLRSDHLGRVEKDRQTKLLYALEHGEKIHIRKVSPVDVGTDVHPPDSRQR